MRGNVEIIFYTPAEEECWVQWIKDVEDGAPRKEEMKNATEETHG